MPSYLEQWDLLAYSVWWTRYGINNQGIVIRGLAGTREFSFQQSVQRGSEAHSVSFLSNENWGRFYGGNAVYLTITFI